MSDLYCPATLIVARHGEAAYNQPWVVSDDGGWLTEVGRDQARALADRLQDRRVAAIWCSDLSRAVQTAEVAASRLDAPVRVRAELREASVGALAGLPDGPARFDDIYRRWLAGDLTVGPPGAETGQAVFRRMRAVLESAADEFRGETVLLVSHGAAIGVTVPRLADNVAADFALGRPIGNATCSEVAVDADRWMLRTWADTPVPAAA